ncbi:FkbM family methyltransferase [Bosea caraganae]|uniref:FkbM family methyltransferase n=2 Tax=Bosea caraganae TaxID=2763117 RepID=A0A370L4Z4_9HYPH|nr:FkbM family methyltransferase [Bosea caraganae]RDJ30133.1 FkbM family methyltransferase [Bosea caraganae]
MLMAQLSVLDRVGCKLKGTFREMRGAQIVSNDGIRLIVDRDQLKDDAIIRALLFDRHERTEAALVKYCLRPGDRVLELGSGVGFITMLCARICGAANVVTLEGNPTMHALLVRNLAMNRYAVDARQSVVSLDGGPVTFHLSESLVSSSMLDRGDAAAETVPSTSFRDLLAEIEPTVVIMDIEGSEIDLLGTCPMPSVRAIGVETHPQIVGEDAIAAMDRRLAALGFQVDERFPTASKRCLYVREPRKN